MTSGKASPTSHTPLGVGLAGTGTNHGLEDREMTAVTDQLPASGYRPRRSPTAGVPRLDPADRPDPAELARLRKSVAGAHRVRPRGSHPDRPVG